MHRTCKEISKSCIKRRLSSPKCHSLFHILYCWVPATKERKYIYTFCHLSNSWVITSSFKNSKIFNECAVKHSFSNTSWQINRFLQCVSYLFQYGSEGDEGYCQLKQVQTTHKKVSKTSSKPLKRKIKLTTWQAAVFFSLSRDFIAIIQIPSNIRNVFVNWMA